MPDPDPGLMTLFTEALERTDPADRAAYLERACGGDADLRRRVEVLLAAHAGAGRFLEPDATGTVAPDGATADLPAVLETGASQPDRDTSTYAHADPDATGVMGSPAHRPCTDGRPSDGVIGSVVGGRYTLVGVIGEGGMGSVYLAEQTEPVKRQVALKLIKTGMDSRAVLARFDAERQALAVMDHPNIARIYDGGVTDRGQPFFVMELVRGVPITEYCDRQRLLVGSRLQLFVQVCQAIQHAHQKGIIHRDLKPGNVLVTEVDGRPTPKVIDFGVAKATEQKLTDLSFSDVGAIVGTPAYMSPEQADPSSMDIDTRTDVYALGVILYELLTGSPPIDASQFRRGAILEMLRMVREVEPPRPSTKLSTADDLPNIAANRGIEPAKLAKLLQGELDWVVLKALEKDRTRRYDTANAFARDIQRYLADEVVEARPPSRGYRLKKFVKRNKVQVFAAGLVVVALVGGIAGTTWGYFRAEDRRQEADRARADESQRVTERDAALRDVVQEKNATALARVAAEVGGYLSDVALADQLWKANDLVGVRETLARCPPALRKWEWHHLNGLARPPTAYDTRALAVSLAYSPDGRYLAYQTLDGTLAVRDAKTGEERFTSGPAPTLDRCRPLAFRPDGTLLAFTGGTQVRVLDLRTWRVTDVPRGKLAGQAGLSNLLALRYAPDGLIVGVVMNQDFKAKTSTFVVHGVTTGKVIASLPAWELRREVIVEISAAAFSPDGTLFAASAVDSGIRIMGKDADDKSGTFRPVVLTWDVASAKVLNRTETGGALFGDVAFAPGGEAVAFGRRGQVGELNARAGEPRLLAGHTGDVGAVALDRNGLIWSGGVDKFIRAHDRATGRERFVLRGCPHAVHRLAVSPDGQEVLASVGDTYGTGRVLRFDLSGPSADVWRVPATPDRVSLIVTLSPDAARFVASDFSIRETGGRFVLRETAGGAERRGQTATAWTFGCSHPDGLVVYNPNKRAFDVIDGNGGRTASLSWPAETHPSASVVAACSPDGKTIAAVAAARPVGKKDNPVATRALVQTWDGLTWQAGRTLSTDLADTLTKGTMEVTALLPLAACIDADGRLAGTFAVSLRQPGSSHTDLSGAVVVWDLASGKELFRRATPVPLRAVGFDPRGRVVAAGGVAGGVVLGWDVATGAETLNIRGHTRPILSFAFGPDGRLATGGGDQVVKVWDADSGRELLTLDGFARDVTHVGFTRDGSLVAATGFDMLSVLTTAALPSEWPPAEVRIFRAGK